MRSGNESKMPKKKLWPLRWAYLCRPKLKPKQTPTSRLLVASNQHKRGRMVLILRRAGRIENPEETADTGAIAVAVAVAVRGESGDEIAVMTTGGVANDDITDVMRIGIAGEMKIGIGIGIGIGRVIVTTVVIGTGLGQGINIAGGDLAHAHETGVLAEMTSIINTDEQIAVIPPQSAESMPSDAETEKATIVETNFTNCLHLPL